MNDNSEQQQNNNNKINNNNKKQITRIQMCAHLRNDLMQNLQIAAMHHYTYYFHLVLFLSS
jgi:hypothetical protein